MSENAHGLSAVRKLDGGDMSLGRRRTEAQAWRVGTVQEEETQPHCWAPTLGPGGLTWFTTIL